MTRRPIASSCLCRFAVADDFDNGTWTDAFVFPLRRLSADDVIDDAVVHFRLAVDVPAGAARNAFVYFRFRAGNATTTTTTTHSFRWQFSRRRNPVRAEECVHVRVVDAVAGRRRSRRRELATFVALSASVGRRQLVQRRRRRQRRSAEQIGVRVLSGPTSPFLTVAVRNGDVCGGDGVNLWDMAAVAPITP